MGLDITAYERLTFIAPKDEAEARELQEEYEYDRGVIKVWVNQDFPTQADGLVHGGFYRREGERLDFRAGPYSAYNRWRAHLAKLTRTTDSAVWKDPQPGPFVELINFSDCEGAIGPETSAKLARDFAEYADRAAEHTAESGWLNVYRHFQKAFEMAAKGGCVRFH